MSPESTKLEAETREEIDEKLIAAGWVIQDKKQLNLYESLGIAVREMDTDVKLQPKIIYQPANNSIHYVQ